MSSRITRKKNNRKQYNRRNITRRGRNGIHHTNGPYDIGTIKTVPIQTRCMRYQSPSNDTDYLFKVSDLLSMIGFSDSTTTGYSLISAVKLQQIKLHLLPDASDLSGTAVFTWLGQFAPNNETSLMYMNAVPASGHFYPLQGTVSSFWLTDTTDTQDLFEINLSTAIPIVLDIHFEYCMPNDSSATTSLSFTAVTAGRVIYPSLPRAMGASARLFPVGLPTG